MSDPGQVLLVHGIGNRERALFEAEAAAMAAALAPRHVELVFWGDLGPEDFLASIPGPDVGIPIGGQPMPSAAEPPRGERASWIAERTRELLSRETASEVPSVTRATVEEVAAELIQLHPDLPPQAIADTLAEGVLLTGPAGSAELDPSTVAGAAPEGDELLSKVHGGLRRIIAALDRGLEDASNRAATSLLRSEKRTGIGRVVARTVGDILTYERNGERIRARLDAAYRAARASSEHVNIVAHSLGALVAVEWLLGAPVDDPDATAPADRRVDTLVTFGCQVALFCELRGLLGPDGMLASTPDAAEVLDLRTGRWCNVWHVLDPLAFVASTVVALAGDLEVEDLRLDLDGPPTSLDFHSAYWRDERFLAWLADAL